MVAHTSFACTLEETAVDHELFAARRYEIAEAGYAACSSIKCHLHDISMSLTLGCVLRLKLCHHLIYHLNHGLLDGRRQFCAVKEILSLNAEDDHTRRQLAKSTR